MKSDMELSKDVRDELAWEPGIDAAAIQVEAHHGAVTLTGTAPHFSTRVLAERAAKRVAGVRAVANDIAVRTAAPNAKSDAEIAEAAVRALEWDTLVPDDRVQVIVRGGRVTLQGAVEWGYQKEAAERAVRNLVGVHHVLNSITVNPRGAAAEIQAKIEAAFRRQAAVDAGQVRVDANGGRVTLRGQVRSWSERSAAERAAWAAPGVSDVENLIQVI